jgi:response regulator RpfG family c-di-GMP phosphodiesterase
MGVNQFDHTVLIVDDEEMIGRALGRLLKSIGIAYVYETSGPAALERLKRTDKPFSLILSDQRMPGMPGSEFLAYAKEVAPDTIRYLITGYSDVQAITASVNKGSIHRYIAKPWDSDVLIETIQSGLNQYELIMENHRLFNLAKEQNAQLYSLNIKLKKKTEAHKKNITRLDHEIKNYNEQLQDGSESKEYLGEITAILVENDLLNEEKLNCLYTALIAELYRQFNGIALRNGFEMPARI